MSKSESMTNLLRRLKRWPRKAIAGDLVLPESTKGPIISQVQHEKFWGTSRKVSSKVPRFSIDARKLKAKEKGILWRIRRSWMLGKICRS